jgi:CheY-like chemotaxis protein
MSKGIRLLVIDDDDINIFIMKKMVQKTGYETDMVSKTNGQIAIDYIKELIETNQPLPDLILIDVNMPVLNGWEFLESYEELNVEKNIEMYMLSSSIYENDREKAKTFKSVKGFICKPLSIEQVTELLQGASSELLNL